MRGCLWITGAAAGANKGLSVLANKSEPEQLAIAQERAQANEDGICFDIGANVGFYSLLFSLNCKHVFAFEPFPRNLSYLERMCRINGLDNVTVLPFAVSDHVGFSSFQAGANCALGKLDRSGGQPVATISCDEFARLYGVTPSIMKIDVEGGEFDLLRGARELLSDAKPDILLSTHGDKLRQDCLALLKGHGYSHIVPLTDSEIDQSSEFLIAAQ